MRTPDGLGQILNSSPAARLVVLLAIFVPSAIPVWLVGSGRLDGAAPEASLLAIGCVVWMLLLISITQRSRGLGWGEIGLRRPPSWPPALLQAVVIAAVALAVAELAEWLVVQPALGEGADVSRFDAVRGNPVALVQTILIIWLTSAFPEEVIWRGFLMTRLTELTGDTRAAWIGAVVLSSAFFGLLHIYQGLPGVILTGLVGVVFGLAFYWIRNVWPLVIAHALMHVVSGIALYLGIS